MIKTIISRSGSEVVLRDTSGKLWLTKRKKLRHDSRRRRNTSGCRVVHIPIRRILERGDWLFTCRMEPVQFDRILPPPDRAQFPGMSDEDWEEFKEDEFCTLEGSYHSKKHCSCTPISDEYAEFFIKHELWTLYRGDFDLYEQDVRTVCQIFNIRYEGI